MSIWGKILGGAAGFALGGPLGALIGATAGHAVDRAAAEFADGVPFAAAPSEEDERSATQRIAFTIGVIVLGAKLAKTDGAVSRAEVDAFKEVFQIPPQEVRNVGRLFNQARADARGFEPYARQVAGMFRPKSPVLEQLLDGLFHIARADGPVGEKEIAYLRETATIFGFSEEDFVRIKAAQLGPDDDDPYAVLGVPRTVADAELRAAYRKLVRENHPDRLIARGMPPEFVEMASRKTATINAAYDRIARERGLT